MKTYLIKRTSAGVTCTVDGAAVPPRLDLYNHSPTGFEFGYGGSGPAQLALAILAHHLGEDNRAIWLHQQFKWDVVARLDKAQHEITSAAIDDWLHKFDQPTEPARLLVDGGA